MRAISYYMLDPETLQLDDGKLDDKFDGKLDAF